MPRYTVRLLPLCPATGPARPSLWCFAAALIHGTVAMAIASKTDLIVDFLPSLKHLVSHRPDTFWRLLLHGRGANKWQSRASAPVELHPHFGSCRRTIHFGTITHLQTLNQSVCRLQSCRDHTPRGDCSVKLPLLRKNSISFQCALACGETSLGEVVSGRVQAAKPTSKSISGRGAMVQLPPPAPLPPTFRFLLPHAERFLVRCADSE